MNQKARSEAVRAAGIAPERQAEMLDRIASIFEVHFTFADAPVLRQEELTSALTWAQGLQAFAKIHPGVAEYLVLPPSKLDEIVRNLGAVVEQDSLAKPSPKGSQKPLDEVLFAMAALWEEFEPNDRGVTKRAGGVDSSQGAFWQEGMWSGRLLELAHGLLDIEGWHVPRVTVARRLNDVISAGETADARFRERLCKCGTSIDDDFDKLEDGANWKPHWFCRACRGKEATATKT